MSGSKESNTHFLLFFIFYFLVPGILFGSRVFYLGPGTWLLFFLKYTQESLFHFKTYIQPDQTIGFTALYLLHVQLFDLFISLD